MKLETPLEIFDLANDYQLKIIDNQYQGKIYGINEIHKVSIGDITFVDTPKYFDKALNSEASVIIINQKIDCPEGKALLYSSNPFKTYNQIAKDHRPFLFSNQMISESAEIDPSTKIFPNVFIGEHVKIGKNCIIYPNVTIYSHTIIEDHVIIHSNTAIGSDAFYYNKQNDVYEKMHSIGHTHIESHVEIGSNCSIDRGVSGITRIGKGSKLDNQIHIAHGVTIGENCLLCAQVAIAGKSKIGNHVTIYGKVGISKGITIGDFAIILASSNVDKNLEGHRRYFGSPAIEARQAMKYFASLRLLPDYIKKINLMLKESEMTSIQQ
jgi:UDP-3-O-[3-hydroxymyristoyl] glucosamine N-acyltransferase